MIVKTAFTALMSIGLTGLAEAASPGQDSQFVKQLYSDVLGRSADRMELSKWVTLLENGGARIQVASALTSSQEYRKLLVEQVYSDYLKRSATPGELSFWLSWLQQGATDDQLQAQVLGSDEFYTKAGGTNSQFLNQLYLDVLGVAIDRVAVASLGQMLSQGTPRSTMATLVLESVAAEQRKVEQWSVCFLRKNADAAMLANYSAAMQAGATDEHVVDLMLASEAYFALATHGR
jgi:Domain of unknown function (DUF4214)